MRFNKPLILLFLLISVLVDPAMGQYNFSVDDAEGCTPFKVKYSFTSTATVDTITSFYWDFGNGVTSTLKAPDTVIYSTAGIYTPALVFNNRADLMIVKPDLITVHHAVPANFNYYDSVSYNVYVFEHSEPLDVGINYTYNWDIEGFLPRSGPRQIVTFPQADTFTVVLTVSDDQGCTNTTSTNVAVFDRISVQNVFTPNGDGKNDFFVITSNGGFAIYLRIFTRSGTLVYENEGSTVTWDGLTASGLELKQGVYFYTIEALQGDPTKRYSKAGVLYLYK